MSALKWLLLLVCGSASLAQALQPLPDKYRVVHVVVALVDNQTQGIVPVPEALGRGDEPRNNLYWGALYGVKTYLQSHKNWQRLDLAPSSNAFVLERVAFAQNIQRGADTVRVLLVADAWKGKNIEEAIAYFLRAAAGQENDISAINDQGHTYALPLGSAAQALAYVGHNGLMDFAAPNVIQGREPAHPRAAFILACHSEHYFAPLLAEGSTELILATRSLMAPEAYTLEAAISAWFAKGEQSSTREAAVAAYARYQKISVSAANRIFSVPENKPVLN